MIHIHAPLMHMYCDHRLEMSPLQLCQILHRQLDEFIQQIQEVFVCLTHDTRISFALSQGIFSLDGPQHLNADQTRLKHMLFICSNGWERHRNGYITWPQYS